MRNAEALKLLTDRNEAPKFFMRPEVHPSEGRFFARVVRVDRDGKEVVIFRGRHFDTREAAERAVAAYTR